MPSLSREDMDPGAPESHDMPLDTPPSPKPDTLSLDTIKAAVQSRATEAKVNLDRLRKERDTLNKRIRVAVAEEQEARRLAAALKPRAARKSKAAK